VAGWGGISFAVLFVVGVMLSANTPEYDESDKEWVDWFNDSGHRTMQVIGAILMVLAALALIWFVAGLVRQLRSAGASETLATAAGGTGFLLAVAVAIAAIAISQVSAAVTFTEYEVPGAEILKFSEHLGFGTLLLMGGWSAAVMVGAVAFAGRKTGLLPGWLQVASYVVAVLLILSLFFIPMVLLPLWVIAVSIVMIRRA
jgi:hypothetical protein